MNIEQKKMNEPLTLKNPTDWHGVWTALVTPFQNDNSKIKIDHKSLTKLIQHQIDNGIDGLVIAGSTGEGSLLGLSRYRELLEASVELVNKRVPIVAGLGIGGTESTLEHAQIALDCRVQGLLAAPPAYIKSPQRSLVNHFLSVASVGLPVCIYEIPGRAAQSIQISTLEKLLSSSSSYSKNIVATKDASGDLVRAVETQKQLNGRIAFLSGDDFTFLPYLAAGGNGIISVVSHLLPQTMKKILSTFRAHRFEQSLELQKGIHEMIEQCFVESNPVPVKSLMCELGVIEKSLFLPPLEKMDEEKLKKSLQIFRSTIQNFPENFKL
jgi:4-hydroxy-tetrahydrodipicolinate synthase